MPRDARQGWIRNVRTIQAPVATGTSLENFYGGAVPSDESAFVLDKAFAIVKVPGAGAGATRTLVVSLVPAAGVTNITLAQATITLAGTATKGLVIPIPLVAAVRGLPVRSSVALRVQVAGGGTQFTTLELQIVLVTMKRPEQS